MTRAGRRLIEDFLLPALNNQKYGDLLKWIDRDKKYFSIKWSHKNAAKWTLADTEVFQDWDRLKGHYHPEVKGYYMQAKQRFRAALYKLSSVIKLTCDDKHVKKYQLIGNSEKKRAEILARTKVSRIAKKEDNRKFIPTSVICENTSCTRKPVTSFSEAACSPPSSPESSEESDKELQKVLQEYTLAQKKQMRYPKQCQDIKEEESVPMECDSSDIKDHSSSHRVPHIPIQPPPMYSNNIITVYDTFQKRFESPQILLVKTYNELDVQRTIKQEEPLDVDCVKREPDEHLSNGLDALNLCLKSEGAYSSR